MELDIEMQPLNITDLAPACTVCLVDNAPPKPNDVLVKVCPEHKIHVHMRCVHKLMGSNWHVDCPNTFDECRHYKPQLILNGVRHTLDYGVFAVKRSFYVGWIFAVAFSVALNVFATFSINDCDFQIYQNSCYIAGVLTHGIASLILVLLFFYYRPTAVTYFKYDHDYVAIQHKLRAEMFVLALAAASGVPLVVILGEVISTHLILGVWVGIVSGIINPLCCIAIGHNLYEITLQISSAEIVFAETSIRSLDEFHQVPTR
jgi:hypothetical protein